MGRAARPPSGTTSRERVWQCGHLERTSQQGSSPQVPFPALSREKVTGMEVPVIPRL